MQQQQINSVKKRNGSIVSFNEEKIVNAIKKAFLSSNHSFNSSIKHKVLNRVYSLIVADPNCNIDSEYVDIEIIQNIVEIALLMEGYMPIAKDYMFYRETKRKEREAKKKLLGVDELSDVEKHYTIGALKIFKERYLLKDNEGNTCERLEDLLKRVAVASGIMDVLYDEEYYNKDGEPQIDEDGQTYINIHPFDPDLEEWEAKYKDLDYKDINKIDCTYIDEFVINPFHKERLLSRYYELQWEGKLDVSFDSIMEKLEDPKYAKRIREYYNLLAHGIFLPNTPTLMNAGTKLGQLSACFTLPIEDSIKGIYKAKTDVAEIFMTGGGIGINYDDLRPRGSLVKTTGGTSPGAVHFLESIDHDTGSISQGGKRRGAAMGILSAWHPDIMEFINKKTKKKDGPLSNHNISVNFTPDFFKTFFEDGEWQLSYKGKVYKTIKARDMMDAIIHKAHECGDPGCVFEDNMNSNNLLYPIYGKPIKETNPCSEISMYPDDSCNLASINMTSFVEDGKFKLYEFMKVCSLVTQFLDGVIDANKYTLPEINEVSKNGRRTGLGMMGLGHMLSMLAIPYNDQIGFTMAEYLTAIMTGEALNTSAHMANVKGPFPFYNDPKYVKGKLPVNAHLNMDLMVDLVSRRKDIEKYFDSMVTIPELYRNIPHREYGLRNCSVTTNAPTGTLSMLVEVSSGIEPDFSLGFTKKVTIGDFYYMNPHFAAALKKEGLYNEVLLDKIVNEHNGTVGKIDEIPEWIKKAFITSMEIHHFDHIMMQAVCQRWITNGISKTINAPEDISPREIEMCYVLSWALGNKGITVYRDKAKEEQVLNTAKHPSDTTILHASPFVEKQILLNKRLPDYYKQDLINLCDTTPTYMSYGEAAANLFKKKDRHVMLCPNCNEVNSLQPNGAKGCQLCKNCGHGIGSCE